VSTKPEYPERAYLNRSRRRFVAGVSAIGGAQLLALSRFASAEPPPETTKLRIMGSGAIVSCIAPVYVAQQLLQAEGFSDVRYIEYPTDTSNWAPEVLLSGEADISLSFTSGHSGRQPYRLRRTGSRQPRSGYAGTEGQERRDSEAGLGRAPFYFDVRGLCRYRPARDINWVIARPVDYVRLLSEGQVDALMSGPTFSQDLRARRIGHVIANTTTDKPWSQYFCCLVASTQDFVREHPVATKRALRAILKSADICALEPSRVAHLIADKGMARYDYTLQMLQEIPYGKWREYDPEDSLRFYALRMRELGMIKSTPHQIISQGTDWRFLNELKKELKA